MRDPREVIASLYFELRRKGARPRYGGSLGEMLGHPRFGILNRWIADWASLPNFKLARYETCREDPAETFRGVLGVAGVTNVDESALRHGIDFAGFENMRRMEAARMFNSVGLSRADPDDPESFRVRRGIVGGYKDYLSAEQIVVLEQAVALLDRRHGYR